MNIYLSLIFGFFAGVLGGLGMGGGTLLIPMLTIFLSLNQHTAQAINLIAFIPMSIVSLFVHFKNNLISFKNILFIIVPAIIFSILASFLANYIQTNILKRCFGVFLIVISLIQTGSFLIKKHCKNKGRFLVKNSR